MRAKLPQKLVRRLSAAEGYLELGMPQHALDELAAETEYGALEAPALYLRGMAFKAQDKYDDAIPAFRQAARMIPPPFSRPVWMQLSECLRHEGQDEMAEIAETFAEAPMAAAAAPVINIQITISPVESEDVDDELDESLFDESGEFEDDSDEDDDFDDEQENEFGEEFESWNEDDSEFRPDREDR